MNKYEMMFIVKATMESDQVKNTAESIKKIVTDLKGNVVEFKELGEKKFRCKQIWDWLYVKKVTGFDDMTNLGKDLILKLKDNFSG